MTEQRQGSGEHARRMDAIYSVQRHFYDVTRKYYLLGRDGLIAALKPPAGGSVLEVGCGTGRNLIAVAKRYRDCQCFGFDISTAMLESAETKVAAKGLGERVTLAQGDATDFDPSEPFGRVHFDRVFCSYTLSMIPDWKAAIRQALALRRAGGELHIVDFGDQRGLPGWFSAGLDWWLAKFHVSPRTDIGDFCAALAQEQGLKAHIRHPHRGYTVAITITD